MRLRDMGLTPKILMEAAKDHGIIISKRRASEIINGITSIKANEMEVIAKIVHRTVDELYIDLGSVLEVICPLLSVGHDKGHLLSCRRQKCAWWDWEKQWCCMKNNTVMGVSNYD